MDQVQALLQASQSGSAMAAQFMHNYLGAQQNTLRMQELRSQEALRQLQEKHLVQQMQYEMQAHDLAVQERADAVKADAKFQLMTTPVIPVEAAGPNVEGGAGVMVPLPNPAFVPNRAEAFIKSYGGMSQYQKDPGKLLLDAATINLHDMQAAQQGKARPRTSEQIAADNALTALRTAETKKVEAQTANEITGKAQAKGNLQKDVEFAEHLLGRQLDQNERENIVAIHQGLKPRAGTARTETKQQFISKFLPKAIQNEAQNPSGTEPGRLWGTRPKAKSPEELATDLSKLYDVIQGHSEDEGKATSAKSPSKTNPNEVTRFLPNGRGAVFDSKTKQFLRYAD